MEDAPSCTGHVSFSDIPLFLGAIGAIVTTAVIAAADAKSRVDERRREEARLRKEARRVERDCRDQWHRLFVAAQRRAVIRARFEAERRLRDELVHHDERGLQRDEALPPVLVGELLEFLQTTDAFQNVTESVLSTFNGLLRPLVYADTGVADALIENYFRATQRTLEASYSAFGSFLHYFPHLQGRVDRFQQKVTDFVRLKNDLLDAVCASDVGRVESLIERGARLLRWEKHGCIYQYDGYRLAFYFEHPKMKRRLSDTSSSSFNHVDWLDDIRSFRRFNKEYRITYDHESRRKIVAMLVGLTEATPNFRLLREYVVSLENSGNPLLFPIEEC